MSEPRAANGEERSVCPLHETVTLFFHRNCPPLGCLVGCVLLLHSLPLCQVENNNIAVTIQGAIQPPCGPRHVSNGQCFPPPTPHVSVARQLVIHLRQISVLLFHKNFQLFLTFKTRSPKPLHLIFKCFVGSIFFRMTQFLLPLLSCVIDWFSEWPEEALQSVARAQFADVEFQDKTIGLLLIFFWGGEVAATIL